LLPHIFQSWLQGRGKINPKYREAKIALSVRIKVLAEWDTVSALWGGRLNFVQGEVPSSVDNSFLAIALDERRWSFQPMIWTKRREPIEGWTVPYDAEGTDKTKKASGESAKAPVRQLLFSGTHSDIGGGNTDSGLSTIPLLWMLASIRQVSKTGFDYDALLQSILPLSSSRSSTDWTSKNNLAPGIEYENILKSKG
jgi:hypothetical protein